MPAHPERRSYHHRHDTGPTKLYTTGHDGVDLLTHAQISHTTVDFRTTMWSYENCKMTFDHPFTVRTIKLGAPCYMYSFLKLVPGMYICTVCCTEIATCRLEIIQRDKECENNVLHRHGCLCAYKTDLKLLITGDTDVELRIVYDQHCDLHIPSFNCMEVRARRKITMPLKTRIQTGLYKPKPIKYSVVDMHKMLKLVHYVIQWLRTIEEHINDVLRMIANPLWDIDENTSAFDFTHHMQEIQNAISTHVPESFIARSFCFCVFIFPGVKVPLISQTLMKELSYCINTKTMEHTKLTNVFRHSLKYINFLVVEYLEFKDCLIKKINALNTSNNTDWNIVKIDV